MAIDPSTTAIVLIEHENVITYDYPMFSKPTTADEFIADLG